MALIAALAGPHRTANESDLRPDSRGRSGPLKPTGRNDRERGALSAALRMLTCGAMLAACSFLAHAQGTPTRIVELSVDEETVTGHGLLRRGTVAPTLRLLQGETVVLRWASNRPVVLHVHGYRLAAEARPGQEGEMAFAAKAAGRFAVETHRSDGRHAALLYLEVMPR